MRSVSRGPRMTRVILLGSVRVNVRRGHRVRGRRDTENGRSVLQIINLLKLAFISYIVRGIRLLSVVSKVCSAGRKGSVTTSQGIHGYISSMANLDFIY